MLIERPGRKHIYEEVKNEVISKQSCYEELAMAIVAQAAKDRCRSFFFSDWFIFLTSGRISGPALWKGVQHNFKTLGRWSVTNEINGSYRHEVMNDPVNNYKRKKRREERCQQQ